MYIDYDERKEKIEEIAQQTGWECTLKKPENCLLRFEKDHTFIDIWWTKMTIGKYLDDEETTEYMYEVSMDDLFELMASPISYKHEGRTKITKRWK